MSKLEIKARGLLLRHSPEYVIQKMSSEKTGRTTTVQIRQIVESLNKIV